MNSHSLLTKRSQYVRLALKILHDVQEPVVDFGLIMELNLDLVEIRKSVLSQASRQCLSSKRLEKHVLFWDGGL